MPIGSTYIAECTIFTEPFFCSNTTDQSQLDTTHDDVERDDVISYGEPLHFRGNCTNPGYVVFTVSCVIQLIVVSVHVFV